MRQQPLEFFPDPQPPKVRRGREGAWEAFCPDCGRRLIFDRPTATEAARAALAMLERHVCAGPGDIPY